MLTQIVRAFKESSLHTALAAAACISSHASSGMGLLAGLCIGGAFGRQVEKSRKSDDAKVTGVLPLKGSNLVQQNYLPCSFMFRKIPLFSKKV